MLCGPLATTIPLDSCKLIASYALHRAHRVLSKTPLWFVHSINQQIVLDMFFHMLQHIAQTYLPSPCTSTITYNHMHKSLWMHIFDVQISIFHLVAFEICPLNSMPCMIISCSKAFLALSKFDLLSSLISNKMFND